MFWDAMRRERNCVLLSIARERVSNAPQSRTFTSSSRIPESRRQSIWSGIAARRASVIPLLGLTILGAHKLH